MESKRNRKGMILSSTGRSRICWSVGLEKEFGNLPEVMAYREFEKMDARGEWPRKKRTIEDMRDNGTLLRALIAVIALFLLLSACYAALNAS